MIPFALQAAVGCPPLDQLHLALAAEFTDVDPGAVADAIEVLAAPLAGAVHDDDETQHALVSREVASRLRLDRDPIGLDDLLLPSVAERRAGNPLALAVLVAAVARRAGLPFGVVAGKNGAWVAHGRMRGGRLIDPAGGLCVEPGACGPQLGWRCAHQTSAGVLDKVLRRSERNGHVAWSVRAAKLRLALPYEGEVLERLERDLQRVRSRLN